jgi:ribosome-associated toxin RatA of RatAB toxin-antitoxin module
MLKRIVNVLLLVVALAAPGAAPALAQADAPPFELAVERVDSAEGGKVYQIASSGTVSAAPAVVWRILTDYDHLADYVPDLDSARVVSRTGATVIVEQRGAAHFLLFSHAIRLRVQVHEQPPDRIDMRLVEGDMKVYRASWQLIPLAGGAGTKVVYNAAIEPAFYMPGIVGVRLVRKDIAGMMAAVLARLDRPDGAHHQDNAP